MAKAVLTTKPQSAYDDLNSVRYHFPRTYLSQIEQSIGDWIVYYEPRRLSTQLNKTGGRQAYFAAAKILRIESDPKLKDHFYAYIGEYLDFDHAVPFKLGGNYFETGLTKADGSTNKGAFGRSVRNIPDHEYEAILRAGFELALVGDDKYYTQGSINLDTEPYNIGVGEHMQLPYERPLVESLTKRPFRDAAFRHVVREAYGLTCAMTGLKIINGGGRPEVQAAHIMSVADNGPDYVRNGVALSGTMHWMFDRGLISIDDDYSILVARNSLPEQALGMVNPTGRLILPPNEDFRPHPKFLQHHRENVFKG